MPSVMPQYACCPSPPPAKNQYMHLRPSVPAWPFAAPQHHFLLLRSTQLVPPSPPFRFQTPSPAPPKLPYSSLPPRPLLPSPLPHPPLPPQTALWRAQQSPSPPPCFPNRSAPLLSPIPASLPPNLA